MGLVSKKNLFNPETFAWTKEGNDIAREVQAALAPIFDAWAEKGYSPREVAHISHSIASTLECAKVMSLRRKPKEKP